MPPELFRPIKRSARTGIIRKPVDFIMPTIDGKITNFFEWQSGGIFDLKADAGSMHAGGGDLKKMFYGFDRKNIYFAIDTDFRESNGLTLEVEILSETGSGSEIYKILLDENSKTKGIEYAIGSIFEASIPIKNEWRQWKNLCLSLRLKRGDTVVEKAPLYSTAEIDISRDFTDEWII